MSRCPPLDDPELAQRVIADICPADGRKHKVQYYAGCDPFVGLSYFNYGRKPALFSSSQIFFYGDIAAGH
jgi:hypothetical protein